MRWLLFGLALLVLPSVAWGQSDTRKVAVWTLQGGDVDGNGGYGTTGNTGTGQWGAASGT